MSEQTKLSQSIKLVLVGKKKTSAVTDTPPKITRALSQKTDTTVNQDSLAQDVRRLNSSVEQLAKCINKLTATFNTPLQQTSQTLKRPDNSQLKDFGKYSSEIQPRDRKIEISPQDELIQNEKLNQQNLKRWTSKMIQIVFSVAFQKFQKKELSLQQTKVYCSQNIINNIVGLSQIYSFTEDNWKRIFLIIDQHIKEQVCPYMLAKYPLTQTNIHNKSLQSIVKQVDNLGSYKNNIFYLSSQNCFNFKYRSSGNYNDLIMNFVNQLLGQLDKPSQTVRADNKKSNTVYQQFREQMTKLFQTVSQSNKGEHDDCCQLNKNQKINNGTSWAIGRKVQKNVPKYSQRQIKNMEFQIKHPSILRILTKWCLQLQNKFKPNYFSRNFDQIFSKVKVLNLTSEIKKKINQAMKIENDDIEQYLKTIKDNKFEEQSSCLKSALQANNFTNMDKIERSSGLFVVNTVNDLHTYIILYLNKLIHKLLWVGKHVGESQDKLKRLEVIPNLLSFTICDLMRCKISSQEQEIKTLYLQIIKMSNENPTLFKVVRVKNRLKDNTNDIQICVLFKEKYLCEIQLKVNSQQSDFMKCSNKFNHFIYQLKRSIFGPISELCSIRKSLDSRTQIYQKMAFKVSSDNKKNKGKVQCNKVSHYLKGTDLPFKCSECGQSSVNLSCFYSHKRCEKCSYWQCGRCGLKSLDQQKLKQSLFEKYEKYGTSQGTLKLVKENEQIPDYGIFFPITQKVKKQLQFSKVKYKQTFGIYIKKQNCKGEAQFEDRFVNFTEFCQEQNQQKFKKANIIFTKQRSRQQKATALQVKHFFLKKAIQSTYVKEKQHICIMHEELDEKFCHSILQDNNQNIRKIKLLDLTSNKITNLQFVNKFTELKRLFLKENELSSLKGIQCLAKVEILYINKNLFDRFPEEILKLKKLKELNISHNKFKELPSNINQLSLLQKLMANNIQVKELPQSIRSLHLKHIALQKNLFEHIPAVLNIPSLQILVLNDNEIKQVEEWVYDLSNLRVLQLNDNGLTSLSQKISKMDKLEKLQIKNNNLTELKIQLPKNLSQINFSSKKLQQISSDVILNCKNLTSISFVNLFQNKLLITLEKLLIQEVIVKLITPKIYFPPGFTNLKNLRLLNLTGYKLQSQSLQNLQSFRKLQQLQLSMMQLSVVPKSIKNLTSLNRLNLSNNKLTKLEAGFFESLIELTYLDLSQNQLEDISDSNIEKCKNLRILNLSHNKLKRINLDLECMKKLVQVHLEYNEETEGIQLKGKPNYIKEIALSSKQIDKVENYEAIKITYGQTFKIVDQPKISDHQLSKT